MFESLPYWLLTLDRSLDLFNFPFPLLQDETETLHKVMIRTKQNGACPVLSTCSMKKPKTSIKELAGWEREKGLGTVPLPISIPPGAPFSRQSLLDLLHCCSRITHLDWGMLMGK